MRVESSDISMASRYQVELTRTTSERLKVWIGDATPGSSLRGPVGNETWGEGEGAAASDAVAGMLRAENAMTSGISSLTGVRNRFHS